MNSEQGANGSKVSWEAFHHEMTQRDKDQRQRDEQMRGLLEEIRDSLGAMHTSLTTLPCDVHATRLEKIEDNLAYLNRNTLPWRSALNRKTIFGLLGLIATGLGWDKVAQIIGGWEK